MTCASFEGIKAANMSSTELDNLFKGDRNVPYRTAKNRTLTPIVEVLRRRTPLSLRQTEQ